MSSDFGGEAGDPVARGDLAQFFVEAAAKHRERTRPLIGVETEWLPVNPVTGRAHPFAGENGSSRFFRDLLALGFEDPFNAAEPTHLERGGVTINLEPGGQTELSGAAVESLHDAAEELEAITAIAHESAERGGFRFLASAIQPVSIASEVQQVPKRRYKIMVDHFTEHGGPRFLEMMRLTGSVQVSLDFRSEEDAGRKLRAAHLMAPVAGALFANAPIAGGRPTGRQSERLAIWLETDDARSQAFGAVLDGPFSYERLVEEYLLDVPAILVRAEDGGVEAAGPHTFRELLRAGISGRPVTRADWILQLSAIFTDARIKRVVECRAADAPPPGATLAVAAFHVGILYHEAAIDGVLALCAPFASDYRGAMREAAERGIRGRVAGVADTLGELAGRLLTLSREGLKARGLGEERYLEAADEVIASGRSFADHALAVFASGGIEALVAAASI